MGAVSPSRGEGQEGDAHSASSEVERTLFLSFAAQGLVPSFPNSL